MGFNNNFDDRDFRRHPHRHHRDRFDSHGPRGSFESRDPFGHCGRDSCRDHRRHRSRGFFFVFPKRIF